MYEIRGKYRGESWETIDEFDTLKEAQAMLLEYQMAFGAGWRLTIRRKPR